MDTQRSSLRCLTSSSVLHIGFFLLQEKVKEYNLTEWGDAVTELMVDKLKLWRGACLCTGNRPKLWSDSRNTKLHLLDLSSRRVSEWASRAAVKRRIILTLWRSALTWLWRLLQLKVKCFIWHHKMAPVSLISTLISTANTVCFLESLKHWNTVTGMVCVKPGSEALKGEDCLRTEKQAEWRNKDKLG